jgi:hypothetical protein
MTNRFKDEFRRRLYANTVDAYRNLHPDLFHKDGTRKLGSNFARYFWWGFDGVTPYGKKIDREVREWVLYPAWRAGLDIGQKADEGGGTDE